MNAGNKIRNKVRNKKLSEDMCRFLRGKRVYLCGGDVRIKKLAEDCLKDMNVQNALEMEISVSAKQSSFKTGGLMLMFGEIDGTGSTCLQQLDQCMAEMENIKNAEPEAVVYLSDSRVYGKEFGPQKRFCESELGYVCHTAMEEMDCQCMRTAEHLVCRMAKEQNMPVKVVRLKQHPDEEEVSAVMPYILGILVKGIPGEIYNAGEISDKKAPDKKVLDKKALDKEVLNGVSSGQRKEFQKQNHLSWKEDRSPLTPMKIEMNTEKVRNYVASELFE